LSSSTASQYGIGVQAVSGIAAIAAVMAGLVRTVMLNRAPARRQARTTERA
jgi:hypothetical protein